MEQRHTAKKDLFGRLLGVSIRYLEPVFASLNFGLAGDGSLIIDTASGSVHLPFMNTQRYTIEVFKRELDIRLHKIKQGQARIHTASVADEIAKYNHLLESGAITQEEYHTLKQKLIHSR